MAKGPEEIFAAQLMALARQLPLDIKRRLWETLADELEEPAEGEAGAIQEDEGGFMFWGGLDGWEDEEEWDEDWGMDRRELLAAETFAYSYAHYADHLDMGHARFDHDMPETVDTLEEAEQEGWDDARLAHALDVPLDQVAGWRAAFRRAVDIVDAPTPAESFRRGVRYSIRDAVEEGLSDEQAIERLVVQICYRAADLAYLLETEDEELSTYSEELRVEPDNGSFLLGADE